MITPLPDRCDLCGACVAICPASALTLGESLLVDHKRCIECMRCIKVCPVAALEYVNRISAKPALSSARAPLQKYQSDVIVIGGGPAGSLASLHAVKNGVTVNLVERRADVGVPVRCGEGIGKKRRFPDHAGAAGMDQEHH